MCPHSHWLNVLLYEKYTEQLVIIYTLLYIYYLIKQIKLFLGRAGRNNWNQHETWNQHDYCFQHQGLRSVKDEFWALIKLVDAYEICL